MSNFGADAVIVGSAIIQIINSNKDNNINQLQKDNNINQLQNRLKNYIRTLKDACYNR
jgi:tryptophan synthase alpha subunit